MDDENFQIITITKYIKIWNWFILSMMFLIGSIILMAIRVKETAIVFFAVFFLTFVFLVFLSLKRQRELKNE